MYRIGIVGCGTIGRRLAETFERHDRTEVWGVCDLDADRAESFADEFDAEPFTDHTALFAGEVDVAYVGVPPVAHVEVATDALDAGAHVICEKPLAETAEAGEELVAAERAHDRVTAVNLPFRYTEGFRELRRRVLASEIGEVRRVELDFRFPQWPREWQDVSWLTSREQGGPLREVGTHFLFGVQEIFGPIREVSARVRYTGPDRYEQSIAGYFTVDGIDTAVDGAGTATGGNPVEGVIDLACNHAVSERNAITVVGSDGTLSLTDWYRLVAEPGEDDERVLVGEPTPTTDRLVNHVVTAIDATADGEASGTDTAAGGRAGDGVADLVSFAEANRVQRVVDSVFASEGDLLELPDEPILRSDGGE